jgi:hypothetical protein
LKLSSAEYAEGIPVLSNWSHPAIWQGFLVATVLFVVMVALTVQSFRNTLK